MENKTYIVYLHINPNNEKVYVGITNQNAHKRWKNGHGYTKCKKFYNAIIKYGWNSFKHIILCRTCKDRALLLEKTLVKYYKNKNLSYNITDGGEDSIPSMLGRHHTDETKKKIRDAAKRPASKEKKIKISIANRGSNNGMFGKPMPLYTKSAIVAAISKPVLQLDSNNSIINRFSSASEAERHLNGKGSHISCCCLGKRKTAYGYKWKYE
jgi:group I intron endonuclease